MSKFRVLTRIVAVALAMVSSMSLSAQTLTWYSPKYWDNNTEQDIWCENASLIVKFRDAPNAKLRAKICFLIGFENNVPKELSVLIGGPGGGFLSTRCNHSGSRAIVHIDGSAEAYCTTGYDEKSNVFRLNNVKLKDMLAGGDFSVSDLCDNFVRLGIGVLDFTVKNIDNDNYRDYSLVVSDTGDAFADIRLNESKHGFRNIFSQVNLIEWKYTVKDLVNGIPMSENGGYRYNVKESLKNLAMITGGHIKTDSDGTSVRPNSVKWNDNDINLIWDAGDLVLYSISPNRYTGVYSAKQFASELKQLGFREIQAADISGGDWNICLIGKSPQGENLRIAIFGFSDSIIVHF